MTAKFVEDLIVGEWEVMQFIGLHDKNGKEIYEEDIVREIQADVKATVIQDELGWDVSDYPDTISLVDAESIEVIGNIYENPYLLK